MAKLLKTNDEKFMMTCFEFDDLNKKTRDIVMQDTAEFLMVDREEDESYPIDEEIVETIKINEWLFDFRGEIVPVVHYCGKHPLSGQHAIRLFGEERMCTLTNGE